MEIIKNSLYQLYALSGKLFLLLIIGIIKFRFLVFLPLINQLSDFYPIIRQFLAKHKASSIAFISILTLSSLWFNEVQANAQNTIQSAGSGTFDKWSIEPKKPSNSAPITTPDGNKQQDKWTVKPAETPPPVVAIAKPQEAKPNTSYHRRSDSYATNPDSDPHEWWNDLGTVSTRDSVKFKYR